MYHNYAFDGVATSIVIAQFPDHHISVESVALAPGWTSQIGHNGPSEVEIHFFNASTHQEAQFSAEREGQSIEVSREY